MPRSYYNDSGIVIKTQDYKEADKVITVVTEFHGLVHYFAVGSRRNNSKKAAHLDLVSLIRFSANTTNQQSYLIQVDSHEFFSGIKKDLRKISIAMSFLEILYHLLPAEAEDKEIFISLKNFLHELNKSENEKQNNKLSSQFGQYLLRHLGYPPPKDSTSISLSSYFETLMNRKIIGKEIR